jgi:hypothetical protein
MTPLPCCADSVRNNRKTHSYLLSSFDRKQRFGGAGRNTGRILAQETRHLIRKNHRCSIHGMERN